MNFLDTLKKKFSSKKDGDTFDIDLTLADGSIVTVVTEAEQPQAGDQVVDAAGSPVSDAEHLLPDGSAIVTVGGAITEIKPATEKEATEPTLSEVMNSVKENAKDFAAFSKNFQKFQKESEEAFGLLGDQYATMSKKVNLMGKGIKSNYEVPEPEEVKKKKGTSTYDADAVREAREALKNNKYATTIGF